MPKKLRQKFKYLENRKSFYKAFFIIFEGISLKQIYKKNGLERENLIFRDATFSRCIKVISKNYGNTLSYGLGNFVRLQISFIIYPG